MAAKAEIHERNASAFERGLDSAEQLFIRSGYDGTTMRAIASNAQVSLGTIVYHWKTKEELIRQVCERRLDPITQIQKRRLLSCAKSNKISPREVLKNAVCALVEPPLLSIREKDRRYNVQALYGRILTDPSPEVLSISVDILKEATDLYWHLARGSLPELSDEEFYWRHNCAIGSFVFAPSFSYRVAFAKHIDERDPDWSAIAAEIVASMIATLTR